MTKKRKTKLGFVVEARPQFRGAFSVVVLGILVAVVLGPISRVQAAIITVNEDGTGDYTDIPDAVLAAAPGDTIQVAEGEYTGPDLWAEWWPPGDALHDITITGTGSSTRIVRPCFEFPGVKFGCYIGLINCEISNLAIELQNVASTDFVYGVCAESFPAVGGFAINPVVKDVKITVASFGIASFESEGLLAEGNTIVAPNGDIGILCNYCTDPVVANNTISGTYDRHGINAYMSSGVIVTDNLVSGSCWSGILASRSPNSDITANTVSGNCRFGVYSYMSDWTVLADNAISGAGRFGILMNRVSNCTAVSNRIHNFRSTVSSGAPILVEMSQDCDIIENTLIDVYDHVNYVQGRGPVAGVHVCGYGTWTDPCVNNTVRGNDYSASGLPGFKASATGFVTPGCVLLEAGWWDGQYGEAVNNTVDEGLFPVLDPHQSDVCNQVVDLSLGSNTVIGAETCDSQAYSHLVNMLEHYLRMEELGAELEEQLPNFPYRNWPAKP